MGCSMPNPKCDHYDPSCGFCRRLPESNYPPVINGEFVEKSAQQPEDEAEPSASDNTANSASLKEIADKLESYLGKGGGILGHLVDIKECIRQLRHL